MKETLRRKFIRTAMVAVTVLLVVLLGAINLVNWWQTNRQAEHMLSLLIQQGEPPQHQENSVSGLLVPPLNADDQEAARFFQVFYDENDQVVRVDLGQISTVTQGEALGYAEDCQGETQGRTGRFLFCRAATVDGRGEVLLFLDVSSSNRAMLAVLAISGAIGAICWLGALLLVTILSRRAIEPMAQNIEKQRQFVTNAGHEIKTPLAIIQANTDAMELYQGQTKWSKNIRDQVLRLTKLTENLLTLARMEEARLPTAQQVDFSALAREACAAFQETAEQKNLALETEIAPEVSLFINRDQLMQLLSILLDNAVKYTQPGGAILLTLFTADGSVCLQVRNTPALLPEGDLSRLFDRFCRGDLARTQKTGGFGIGLSAAQAIVQTWKGTITTAREGKNTALFSVTL